MISLLGCPLSKSFYRQKYFYDELGSQLFDQICDVPEYYPTRAEDGLLKEISDSLIIDLKPDSIFELAAALLGKPDAFWMLASLPIVSQIITL